MIGPASLRGRLLLCMGLGLSVLWLVLAVWLHGEVRDRVARVLDQRLAASARMVVSLLESLAGLVDADRELTLCRELTKRFETVRRGPVTELLEWVRGDKDQRRGELVLVLSPAPRGEQLSEQDRALAKALLAELPVSRAARILAAHTGLKRQELYNYLEGVNS